jgi:hypothetical protein
LGPIRAQLEKQKRQDAAGALRAAIKEAARALGEYLTTNGEQIQVRLGNAAKRISFGSVPSADGQYVSVVFDSRGVRVLQFRDGADTIVQTGDQPASVELAVEFFAYYGSGERDPTRVRLIVSWLQGQLNAIDS